MARATKGDEYATPIWLIQMVREVLGEIEFDPCSSEWHQQRVKAKTYCTKDRDCLKNSRQLWEGKKFWLNPPYSRPGKVIECAVVSMTHWSARGLIITNSTTETQAYQRMLCLNHPICFPAKRINFDHPDPSVSTDRNEYRQTIFCLGVSLWDDFRRVFGRLGAIR